MGGRQAVACRPPCVSCALAYAILTRRGVAHSISRTIFIQLLSAKLISVSTACQDIFPKNQTDYSASVRIIIRFFGALLDRLSHFAFCGRHTVEERIFFTRAIAQMFNFFNFLIMLVTNLQSPRSGRPVANQYLIVTNNGERIFRSYFSNICKITKDGTVYLDEYYWNYSHTTTKYLKEFLQMSLEQIHANIRSGVFKMKELNR